MTSSPPGMQNPIGCRETGPAHEHAGPWPLRDVYDELSVNLATFNQLMSRHHILECE